MYEWEDGAKGAAHYLICFHYNSQSEFMHKSNWLFNIGYVYTTYSRVPL